VGDTERFRRWVIFRVGEDRPLIVHLIYQLRNSRWEQFLNLSVAMNQGHPTDRFGKLSVRKAFNPH